MKQFLEILMYVYLTLIFVILLITIMILPFVLTAYFNSGWWLMLYGIIIPVMVALVIQHLHIKHKKEVEEGALG